MAPTLRERILAFVNAHPGHTDREITNEVCGRSEVQQPVNQECRRLEGQGLLVRRKRGDGLIGNYLPAGVPSSTLPSLPAASDIKGHVLRWLTDQSAAAVPSPSTPPSRSVADA